MPAGGVIASGGTLVSVAEPYNERFTALTAFEQCVVSAAARLAGT